MRMTIYKRLDDIEAQAAQRPDRTGWKDIGQAFADAYGGPYEQLLVSPQFMADLEKVYGPTTTDIHD